MKAEAITRATGLGHPEGPFELDDGRVVYANTYASEIGVWDPRTGEQGTFANVGGGPNACVLGTDGCLYSTQTPNVGAWVAPVHRPPSIQRIHPDGRVEMMVREAGGQPFDGPNDLCFAPDGSLWFTDSGDWDPVARPHPGRIVRVAPDGVATVVETLDHVYPNGIVAEPDGSIVWVESFTNRVVRRGLDGSRSVIHTLREGHIPDGLKVDIEGNLWITTVASGGIDVIAQDGRHLDFLEVGGTILNCCFGRGGKLYCCDMGPYDVTGAAMSGRLVEVAVGVEGMTPFRGAITGPAA
jgi:gluconolactonase